MNYNKNSVLLATLKLKGPLTRPLIWAYAENFNLYSGQTNLKVWLNKLVDTNRIIRTAKHTSAIPSFEYSINEQHPKNQFSSEVYDRIKNEIDSFESIVEATKREKKL